MPDQVPPATDNMAVLSIMVLFAIVFHSISKNVSSKINDPCDKSATTKKNFFLLPKSSNLHNISITRQVAIFVL